MLGVMPPVRSRRAEYTESTRDAVLDAAAELFVQRGYPRTSLDEVAASARVTKGAIYHHFVNKAALMTALIEREELEATRLTRAAFEETAERDGTAAGALAAIDAFLEHCSEHAYGALVFREAPLALGWTDWQACEEKYAVAVVEDVLGRLVDDGVIPGPVGATLVSVVFGMLGTAGQLLADSPASEHVRVRGELHRTFAAFLAGLRLSSRG